MNTKYEPSAEKKTLADTLLAIESRTSTSSAEEREVVQKVLHRDRRRIRILTWATIGFFLLAVIGIYWNFHLAKTEVYSKIFRCQDQISRQDITGVERHILILLQEAYMSQFKNILAASVAFAAILVAAFCTVLLIMVTRRATLRQIQASLVALSEKLDALRPSLRE
jgi:multisubunit Na+/H+ antiporter MnhB subunit